MALTKTTITAAITPSALTFAVTSATNFSVGKQVKIDNEYIGGITAVSGTTITVRGRGDQGTAAVAHNILAPIQVAADPSDWPAVTAGSASPVPAYTDDVVYYGASGAITVPIKDTRLIMNKAGASVMTLGDPSKASDGMQVNIASATAQAHTVTNTTGFNAGGTTIDVATFGGAIGDNFTIEAVAGTWVVLNAVNVTIA